MFRFIDLHLSNWKTDRNRKPLILRGARQVGKTFAVRKLGKQFKTFIEINFEKSPKFKDIFESNLDPKRIIQILSAEFNVKIIPGETLIFFDEVHEAPRALLSLRYFYEEIPELHVLAAGSLLNLAIEEVGVPVGRISFFHIYPMSLLEFLKALNQDLLIELILSHAPNQPIDNFTHETLLTLLSEYLAIGGMPAVIQSWCTIKETYECFKIQQSIIDTYRNDFPKYSKKLQVKYVELIFEQLALQLGQKFKFTEVPGEYRKRELLPALELLVKADLAHLIYHSDSQGLPIGAQLDFNKFKGILLDVGLTQAIAGLKISDWLINFKQNLINKGGIAEAFIGQEILAYGNPFQSKSLYYWQRDSKNSQAEVDYVMQCHDKIIPIEVKSDKGKTLKSMSLFLESHPLSEFGIRFSTHNFSLHDKIHSYPLYAVAAFLKDQELFSSE